MIPVTQEFHDEAVGQIVEPKAACLISFSKGLSGGRQYFKLNYSNLTGKDLLQGSSDDPIQNWDEYQYVDYSDRIVSMEWERAVDFPDQVQSALCDVTFDNHDGFFDPANTVSPIYANNAIDRPLKLYAGYRNSGLIPQFVGMTDAPPTLNDKQKTATYHGIDYLYAIGQQELTDIVAMRNVRTDEVLEKIFRQFGLEGLNYKIYGNSVQNGVPTPNTPVEIESVGDLSENILDLSSLEPRTPSGVTMSANDQKIVMTGTATAGYTLGNVMSFNLASGTKIAFSAKALSDKFSGLMVKAVFYNGSTYFAELLAPGTLTLAQQCTSVRIQISGYPVGTAFNNDEWIVDLRNGTTPAVYPTPYAKYSIPVTVTGKNLVNFPDIISKQITNRYYDDQSTQFKMTPGETYTVSFIVESSITPFTVSALVGSPSAPIADIPGATLTNQENGYKVITFTCPNTENSYLWLRPVRYNSAQTYYYSVRYVQVEKGSTATSYTPGPVTTNIILDEPLRKIGDYADYIDFKTQRVVRRIRSTVITEQNKNTLVTVSSTTGTYPAAYISKSALGNPTPSYSAIPMLMNRYSANGVANYSFRTTSTTNSVEIFDNRFTNLTTARNLLVGLEILSVPEIAAESPVYLPPIRFLSSGFSAVSIGTNIQPSNFILNLPQYQLPQGTNVIPFLFFDKGTRAGDVFRQLMQAEYGLLWLDENGTIQFRPRTYALPDPVYNFQPYSIVSIKALGSQKIINHVRISSDIREVQEYQEVYYKKDSSQTQTSAESTWAVGPHRTVVISASLNDPCYDIVTPTLGHASSVSWFRAHKEGGVEVLSGITCTGELTTNSYKLSFTNNNDFSVEITELVLWGEPAKIINQLSIDVKDTDSVEKYGDQVLEINNNPFIQSLSQAQTLARYILASRANYNSSIEMEVRGDFSLQIGDVVTIPGEYYGQYMIDSIAVKMSAGSLSTVLSLHYSKSVPAFKLNNSKLNSEALLV